MDLLEIIKRNCTKISGLLGKVPGIPPCMYP